MKAENERIDRENEEARKKRKGASEDEILNTFKTYPKVMELERRLRILSSFYQENPNLEKVLESLKKAGDENGS